MEKPKRMVFKEYLVEKILAGLKTQTRRLQKFGEEEPKYHRGDILYVPESFCKTDDGVIHYRLDEPDAKLHWQASLFMPMRYARVWLEVDEVLSQCLHDITEEDAQSEGFADGLERGARLTAIGHFARVFNECYGDGIWFLNPFVWVVKFHRVKPPVRMLVDREK